MKTILLFFVLALTLPSLNATTIAYHVGRNDPTTEGWIEVGPFCSPSCPTAPDASATSVAWNVTVPATRYYTTLTYDTSVSNAQVLTGQTNGWTLDAELAVLDPAGTAPNASVFVSYETGTTRYGMFFGTDADGNAEVSLSSGYDAVTGITAFQTIDTGLTSFNNYQLVWNTAEGAADLYINGTLEVTGYTGDTYQPGQAVIFGADGSPGAGSGSYARVSLDIVDGASAPEPDTTFLVGSGCLMVGLLIRHFKRS